MSFEEGDHVHLRLHRKHYALLKGNTNITNITGSTGSCGLAALRASEDAPEKRRLQPLHSTVGRANGHHCRGAQEDAGLD